MPSFSINTLTTTAHTLNVGNAGIIGQGGALQVFGGPAVTMTASNTLLVHGTISAFGTAVFGSAASTVEVLLSQNASILSNGTGIHADVTDSTKIVNHGTISGTFTALSLTADSNAEIPVNHDVVNTGILSSTNAAAVIVAHNTSGFTEFNNSGVISSTSTAVDASGSNSGITVFRNTGEILSGQDVNDAGSIDYAYRGGAGADHFFNQGLVSGTIELGGGADFFYGYGGQVNGEVRGGGGDDTYFVDDNSIEIVELGGGGGFDVINAASDYRLAANVEALTLTGAGDFNGIGNSEANLIAGNDGSNRLSGGLGGDVISGGDGEDSIFGGAEADQLFGGEGNDYMSSGSGNDTLLGDDGEDVLLGRRGSDSLNGGNGADTLFGGSSDDSLVGGRGEDVLIGGQGADKMNAGSGIDTFVWLAPADSLASNRDTINGYEAGLDRLDLTAVMPDSFDINIGAGFTGGGTASVRTFETGGGDTRVFVDVDGDNTADMRFDIIGVTGVTSVDFIV